MVLNDKSSIAKSFPPPDILESIILIVAKLAPPDAQVPVIFVQLQTVVAGVPAVTLLVAEIGDIVIGLPFIKTSKVALTPSPIFCTQKEKLYVLEFSTGTVCDQITLFAVVAPSATSIFPVPVVLSAQVVNLLYHNDGFVTIPYANWAPLVFVNE